MTLTLEMAQAMDAAYSQPPAYQNPSKTAHVVRGVVANVNVFLWLGTEDMAEWFEDFNPLEDTVPGLGPVHQPSLSNVRDIMPQILVTLSSLGWPPYYVAGHSKGAREAPVFHALMKIAGHPTSAGTWLFEPPRAGGPGLRDALSGETIIATQTFNSSGSDIVTLIPDGPEWVDIVPPTRLRVSDALGMGDKHVMTGVLSGLSQ